MPNTPRNFEPPFTDVPGAIADFRAGRMVVLVDDEDRENEGDLSIASEHVTPEAINFMAKYGRGLICLTLTEERADYLRLFPMSQQNSSRFGTAFTETIEAREGVTTGISAYDRAHLMSAEYDDSILAKVADERIRTFQADAAREAGIFHHLITLPTYHTAALSTDNLAKDYFGNQGMLGYVAGVQRKEIRQGIACVKHQNMSGSDIGDDHKEYFSGEAALKAGGKHNTMNQF